MARNLLRQNKDLEANIEARHSEKSGLNREISRLYREISGLTIEISEFKVKKSELKATIKVLESENERLKSTFTTG